MSTVIQQLPFLTILQLFANIRLPSFLAFCQLRTRAPTDYRNQFNPFNVSCSKLLMFKGFSAILV